MWRWRRCGSRLVVLIGVVEWRGEDQRGGFSVVVVGKIDRFFVCVCVFFSLLLLVIMWWLFLVDVVVVGGF